MTTTTSLSVTPRLKTRKFTLSRPLCIVGTHFTTGAHYVPFFPCICTLTTYCNPHLEIKGDAVPQTSITRAYWDAQGKATPRSSFLRRQAPESPLTWSRTAVPCHTYLRDQSCRGVPCGKALAGRQSQTASTLAMLAHSSAVSTVASSGSGQGRLQSHACNDPSRAREGGPLAAVAGAVAAGLVLCGTVLVSPILRYTGSMVAGRLPG